MIKIKNLLIASLAVVVLYGCRNESTEDTNDNADSIIVEQEITDSTAVVKDSLTLPYLVKFDENTGQFEIEKNPAADTVSIDGEQLTLALNKKYPQIALRIGERKNDTLELHIDDAAYLTQSIGSAGANAYLAETTYAFTSIDSIEVINLLFEPGDHAMPGPYTRKFFDDFN